ncbi:hypothetical protein STEG23_017495 [Scotinomys teguina]
MSVDIHGTHVYGHTRHTCRLWTYTAHMSSVDIHGTHVYGHTRHTCLWTYTAHMSMDIHGIFIDEYRIKPVEEAKYMKNGAEEDQKVVARNQENLRKLSLLILMFLNTLNFASDNDSNLEMTTAYSVSSSLSAVAPWSASHPFTLWKIPPLHRV